MPCFVAADNLDTGRHCRRERLEVSKGNCRPGRRTPSMCTALSARAIAEQAKQIVADNGYQDKVTIIHGKVEDTELPVPQVLAAKSMFMLPHARSGLPACHPGMALQVCWSVVAGIVNSNGWLQAQQQVQYGMPPASNPWSEY